MAKLTFSGGALENGVLHRTAKLASIATAMIPYYNVHLSEGLRETKLF